MAKEIDKDSKIKDLKEKLALQGEATRQYYKLASEKDDAIDRLQMENQSLHKLLVQTKREREQALSRIDRNHRYIERARYEREIIGNELNKLQHRIGRQRESNRAMHRELKELRDRVRDTPGKEKR